MLSFLGRRLVSLLVGEALPTRIFKDLVDLCSGFFLPARQQVTVNIERHARAGMADLRLDGLQVDAGCDHKRDCGVAEVVESRPLGKTCSLQDGMERPLQQVGGVERATHQIAEHQVVIGPKQAGGRSFLPLTDLLIS